MDRCPSQGGVRQLQNSVQKPCWRKSRVDAKLLNKEFACSVWLQGVLARPGSAPSQWPREAQRRDAVHAKLASSDMILAGHIK